jgi:tRNA(adenine34) deaminase
MIIEPADIAAMAWALDAARELTPIGDVPVGAVVLDANWEVIGRGANRREHDDNPAGHAELLASQDAARTLGTWRLDGCTLVVTLEPCIMCAGVLVQSRIARLVFGAFDDKAGAAGSVWDLVRDPSLNHRPVVVSGVRAQESGDLLREFFRAQRHR